MRCVYVEKRDSTVAEENWLKEKASVTIGTVSEMTGKMVLKRKSFTFWHVFTLISSLICFVAYSFFPFLLLYEMIPEKIDDAHRKKRQPVLKHAAQWEATKKRVHK